MARKAAADSLAEYRRKRDFAKTAEPAGKWVRKKGNSLVVQKHAATRLHYDFRLELDGVLKSWAVTKGPSLDPAEKRLAVRTEDHPLEYGRFEGTIPEGQYGGGTVMLWDRGTWEPLSDPQAGLKEGKLHFRLNGERLKGGWALIRMPPRGKEKRENWLLIKERDEYSDESDPILSEFTTSVATGRTMEEIAQGDSAVSHSNRPGRGNAGSAARTRRRMVKSPSLPAFRPPQLATLVDEPPEGDDWVHELKFDGYRCLVAANGPEVRCYTRNGLDWTDKFRRIADAIGAMDLPGVLIDGEVAAFTPQGRSDFSTLQKTLSEGGPIAYFAFDLIEAAGEDLAQRPLVERKDRLQALLDDLPKKSPIHFSTHIRGDGHAVLAGVCAAGHEGIVSKKISAPYRSRRTRTWLKTKCSKRQEFVIGGWTPSDRRSGFKSLLLGAWDDGQLVYVGRVGTGFDEDDLRELSARLQKLARRDSPFVNVPRDVARRASWVEPRLVAEIAFTEFTSDGILRHPSYLGLREDKPAREVTLEKPTPVEDVMADNRQEGERAGIRVTNPDKVLFPAQGLSKSDLLDYYEAVAALMLPHIVNRPLSLVRCPQGRSSKCFFQKHDTGGFPVAMRRVMIKESGGKEAQYFYVTDLTGIVAGVQMGVLEFHIWGSRVDQVEKPDRIIFDLDPDVGLGFEDVRDAAFDLRDRLAEIGLTTFPLLTGGKGFHLVAPILRRAEWPELKAFCRAFAVMVAEESPDRYVANMAKARRKGRTFIDYLRNDRGSTAIAPYSTRAREGAPVAAPITWDEAARVAAANIFTVENMPERARKTGDPWSGYFDVKQSITKTMLEAVGAL
jgi:bifunctional non-homologous end joining protein LigD